jgi:hypothetical protein
VAAELKLILEVTLLSISEKLKVMVQCGTKRSFGNKESDQKGSDWVAFRSFF